MHDDDLDYHDPFEDEIYFDPFDDFIDLDAEEHATSASPLTPPEQDPARWINDLRSPEWAVRRSAMEQLENIGASAVDGLIVALEIGARVQRDAVCRVLVRIGSGSIPALVSLLNASEDDLRERAAWMLGYLGTEPAVTALKTALNDSDGAVRAAAQTALDRIAGKLPQFIPDEPGEQPPLKPPDDTIATPETDS